MTEPITPLQQSLDLSSNKFVQACAGAGKTFALSKRFCAILDDFIGLNRKNRGGEQLGVHNILVITFTKKAAAEMAQRIYRDLTALLSGMPIPELEDQGVVIGDTIRNAEEKEKQRLYSTFSQNAISTIDSFCAGVLRNHADLVGLDPQFVLEDEVFARRYFMQTLTGLLDECSQEKNSDLGLLLESMAPNRIVEYIEHIDRFRHVLDSWIESVKSQSESAIREDWIRTFTPEFAVAPVLNKLKKIAGFADSEKDECDKSNDFLRPLVDGLAGFSETAPDHDRRRYIILEVISHLTLKDGKRYRSSIPGNKQNWSDKDECGEYKRLTQELINELETTVLPAEALASAPSDADLETVNFFKALLRIYDTFDRRYSNVKAAHNFLTFNDVLIYTRNLFRNHEKVRAKYSRLYRHILVDEFQDTNELHWDIIQLIARDSKGSLRGKGLFIVGDRKQSIYRFNQADVEVMNHAQNSIECSAEPSRETVIEFNENFRSSEDYLKSVINPVFKVVMPDRPPEVRKSYEAAFSSSFHAGPHSVSDARIADRTACCSLVRATVSGDDAENEYVPALHTALTVREFLEWGRQSGLDQSGKPVVAVLLRTFTKIQHYLQIFQRYGIKCEIVGGRHLFEQQEAYDLFHLVSVMINPHDDYALVGLLRSPIFLCSDRQIHRLRAEERGKGTSIFSYMSKLEEFDTVIDCINRWRELSRVMPLDRLLESVIGEGYREFGYYSEAGGPQRIANIDKIVSVIHSLSLAGVSLFEVYDYLKFQIESGADAPQAEPPGEALVQIMTIHKSKGLEFPAVILPELHRTGPPNRRAISHGRMYGGNFAVGISLISPGEEAEYNMINAIKAQESDEENAESARLFYVAVTRAQYRAAFLADFKEIKESRAQNWWNRFIRPVYNPPESGDPDVWNSFESGLQKTEYSLLPLSELKKKLGEEAVETVEWSEAEKLPGTRRYREMSVVNLSDDMQKLSQSRTAEESQSFPDDGFSQEYGLLYHKVMEKKWWDYHGSLQEIQAYLDRTCRNSDIKKRLLERLRAELSLFRGSELYKMFEEADQEQFFPELGIQGWIDNHELYLKVSGAIDLLFYVNNRWFVLDYKTSEMTDATGLDKYDTQVQTYIWMVKQLYNIDAEGMIYFSATGQLRKVPESERYFSMIDPESAKTFKFTVIKPFEIALSITDIIKNSGDKSVTVIASAKIQAHNIVRSLAQKRLLRPGISVLTVHEVIGRISGAGNRLSAARARVILHDLLHEQNTTPGLINYLAQAILHQAEYGVSLQDRFIETAQQFRDAARQNRLLTESDSINEFINEKRCFPGTVIVSGFYQLKPLYFEAVRHIARTAESFYFIDNLDNFRCKTEFPYTSDVWDTAVTIPERESGPVCEICFSVEEEVERVAHYILSDSGWKRKIDSVKIAVSSMERYVPVIKRVFGRYGIPTRVAKREPVLERPAAQFVLSLFPLFNRSEHLSWEVVSRVFMHPLMEPSDGLLTFDSWCRRNGAVSLNRIREMIEIREEDAEKRAVFKDELNVIVHALETFFWNGSSAYVSGIESIIKNYDIYERIMNDRVSAGALKKTMSVLKSVAEECAQFGFTFTESEFFRELKIRLAETEVPSIDQEYGFEILGFLDTAQLEPEMLYILGMTEGQIPVEPPGNPCLKHGLPSSWPLSMHLFKRWIQMGGRVIFFSPERNINGDVLRHSTFLEYLKVVKGKNRKQLTPVRTTKRMHFSSYYGKRIELPAAEEFIAIVQRHNGYRDGPESTSEFRGNTGSRSEKRLKLSSRDIDELFKCPFRYWLSRQMQIRALEFKKMNLEKIETGSIIHKALEQFGKSGGFDLLKKDKASAYLHLTGCLAQELEKRNISPSDNLFARYRFRQFLENLEENSEINILVRMLNWNAEELAAFTPIYFEKPFGMPEERYPLSWPGIEISDDRITVNLTGIIDKIMIDHDEKFILATDYKTGSVQLKEIQNFWSSQFFIYYFVLKAQYPDKKVILAYEHLKSLRRNEHGIPFIVGDNDGSDRPLPGSLKTKKHVVICEGSPAPEGTFDSDQVKKMLLDAAIRVEQGNYPLASKESQEHVCKSCDFQKVCRKTCIV
ncbi:UvrD-helicase domain-containing protein [candidate division KSB1 bacterium]